MTKAQADALQTSLENERIIREQNQWLEQKVKERTDEILKKQHEIVEQNEELQLQHEVIEEQNYRLMCYNEDLEVEVNNRTAELLNSNKKLSQQNEKLEHFVSVTSHNIRGPIASILGLANVIDKSQLNAYNTKCIEHLDTAMNKLDEVVKDLNDALACDTASHNIMEMICFEELLSETIGEMQDVLRENLVEITCQFHIPGVYSVRQYLQSILYNLISNAIKYKAPERKPHIHIKSEQVGDSIQLSVKDNGLGIDTERYHDRIFGFYQRFHLHAEGKGLGLYTIKRQMEALGGSIRLESEVGKGATFYMLFKSYKEVALTE